MSCTTKNFVAVDLGAESGRVILGRLAEGRLTTEEAHRFRNEPVRLRDTLCWDLPRLLRDIRRGIRAAAQLADRRIDGLAVDSWGVDFGILDRRGDLLANPVHYRDTRTAGSFDEVFEIVSREDLWSRTGIQFLELNTLFQLHALKKRSPEVLETGARLLLMADLIAYLLGARPVAEVTLASTSHLLDARTRQWSAETLDALGLPPEIFPEVVDSGTVVGELDDEVCREAGLESAPPIIAAASHDTAAAVAAVPATQSGSWAFLSSGTWSLLGVETDRPILSSEALEHGFTNEAGVGGTTRFLRNISGLWLVQECRRQWEREGVELSYSELAEMAEKAAPAVSFIEPNDPRYAAPGDMPARIRDACRESGQAVPEGRAEVVRCVLESLAKTYADTARAASELTGRPIERLHVVGGGSRHDLLNRMTAQQLGVPVVAGPLEATALGNILSQALATGAVADRAEVRSVVAASEEVTEYAAP